MPGPIDAQKSRLMPDPIDASPTDGGPIDAGPIDAQKVLLMPVPIDARPDWCPEGPIDVSPLK